MKILTVVGARPQFVKASMVSKAVQEWQGGEPLKEVLVHTGQHYDANMSQMFFDELHIPQPKYHLGIAEKRHGKMTGRMLEAIEEVLLEEKPDWLLVYGDTNSTLAGALAAKKLHIPVAHVEAGLRTYESTVPEEINRVLTDNCSTHLFPPTQIGYENLLREGKSPEQISLVGDIMYDVWLTFREIALQKSSVLEREKLQEKGFVLSTVHREENTSSRETLGNIFLALEKIAEEVPVVLPLHPRTQKMLAEFGLMERFQGKIHFTEPLGYYDMLVLQGAAKAIVTDSGGVQKEAFFAQVPCLTLKKETAWKELVEHGFNFLVGTDPEEIVNTFHSSLIKEYQWDLPLYGDGKTRDAIVKTLVELMPEEMFVEV